MPPEPLFLQEARQLPSEQFYSVLHKLKDKQEYIDYLDAKWKAQLKNRADLLWLLDYKKIAKKEELKPIENKINQYVSFMKRQPKIYEALKLNFRNAEAVEHEEIEW